MKGSEVLKIEKNPDLPRATKVSCPKTPFFSEQQKFPVQKRHFSPSDKSFLSKNAVFLRATKVSCPKMPFFMNFILGNAGEEKRGGISCECLHFHKYYYKVLKS